MVPKKGQKGNLNETAFRAGAGHGQDTQKSFKGECFYCRKKGHRQSECRSRKKDLEAGTLKPNSGQGPSTGPLPTPSGGRGLSPPPVAQANSATESAWTASAEPVQPELSWVIDSGCSRHMTFSREAFADDYTHLTEPVQVKTASGAVIPGIGTGNVSIRIALNGELRTIQLTDVLYVPKIAGNLISVTQLQDRGISVRTTTDPEDGCKSLLIELQDSVVGIADRIGKTYTLRTSLDKDLEAVALKVTENSTMEATETLTWHRRFGHLSPATLAGIKDVTTGLSKEIPTRKIDCSVCNLTKAVRVINRKAPERATQPLERIHTDIWGPFSIPTKGGAQYIITFTDDYSRKSWVYLVQNRSELHRVFSLFKIERELELQDKNGQGPKIQKIRCDNGPEYQKLGDYIHANYGIYFEYTTVYTPEQNGVAERLNRSLVQIARGMLNDAQLPLQLWGYAIETASYIRNRTPIGPGGLTPEEAYSGKKPYIGHLRAYGCIAYAQVPEEIRGNKLETTGIRTCLVGYMPTSRQYQLFEPERRRIIVSTAPTFKEHLRLGNIDWDMMPPSEVVMPFNPMAPDTTDGVQDEIRRGDNLEPGQVTPERRVNDEIGVSDSLISTPTPVTVRNTDSEGQEVPNSGDPLAADDITTRETAQETLETTIIVDTGSDLDLTDDIQSVEPRRSGRIRQQARRHEAYSATENTRLPRTYKEAITDPQNKAEWTQAITEELQKLIALNTWEVVRLPPGKKPVGCKWVFTKKYLPTGLVDRYKARLVAQGFTQTDGVDYLETFSPTIRNESLRLLLAIAASTGLEVYQVDVISAYPRSKLHAEVYMRPPEALDVEEGYVLRLN